ncbi:MAG: hypothetical protein KAW17_00175 [Candidatus Eisenbacteria sp.]|nr:hypothetical protein [Candidatus Eisenbacteria bacterium]
MTTTDITRIALFIALALASGFALLAVPNVELITLSVFCGGVSLGVRRGALVGLLSMFLFTMFNPYGVAPLPLAGAQVAVMALVGAAGGAESRWIVSRMRSEEGGRSTAGLVALAATGVLLTIVYDVATTLAIAGMLAESGKVSFWVLVVTGSAFSLLHVVSNGLIFCVVGGSAIRALAVWKKAL